jgi:hypothetical protein
MEITTAIKPSSCMDASTQKHHTILEVSRVVIDRGNKSLKGKNVLWKNERLFFDLTAPPVTFFIQPVHQSFNCLGGGRASHATMLGN